MSAVDVSVLSTGHDAADARLHRLVSSLTANGLSVEIIALGTASDGPRQARVTTTCRGSLLHRVLRAGVLPWRSRGRVVIVIDPELTLPALLHRWWRGRTARRSYLVVDIHEDYGKVLMDRSWAHGVRLTAARVIVAISVWASRQADLTVVADDHLPPLRAPVRLVVPNLPILEMLPPARALEPRPRAVYIGDVRRSRGLQTMLLAVEDSPDWCLDVVGPIASTDQEWLRRWRTSSPARDRVTFHGRRPPTEAFRIASGAWVGLCLLDETPAFMSAMPTKIYEYLACGLAVITTPLPRAAALVSTIEAGAVVANCATAAAVLNAWAHRPEVVERHQVAAATWTSQYLRGRVGYPDFVRAVNLLTAQSQKPYESIRTKVRRKDPHQ